MFNGKCSEPGLVISVVDTVVKKKTHGHYSPIRKLKKLYTIKVQ